MDNLAVANFRSASEGYLASLVFEPRGGERC
jgi:hypothetical protein